MPECVSREDVLTSSYAPRHRAAPCSASHGCVWERQSLRRCTRGLVSRCAGKMYEVSTWYMTTSSLLIMARARCDDTPPVLTRRRVVHRASVRSALVTRRDSDAAVELCSLNACSVCVCGATGRVWVTSMW